MNKEVATIAELESLLSRLEDYVKGSDTLNRGGDALRLMMALKECQGFADSDDEAEAIRRGYRLGLSLAAYDRRTFYLAVKSSHLERAIATRAEKIARRNEDLIAEYRTLEVELGCLPARQQLADKYKLTLTRITQILNQYGITINRKS